nr:hypothetical protein [Cytophagales bacterium]
MTKKNTLRPTFLALTLVAAGCSNDEKNADSKGYETIGTWSIKTAEDTPSQPLEERLETPPVTETSAVMLTPAVTQAPSIPVVQERPRRIPQAGPEFTHHYTDARGVRKAVNIDVDRLVVADNPNGGKVLGLTVAFAQQFDSPDPQVMARYSERDRNLILNGATNMSTDPSQVTVMIDHVITMHGVPRDAMRDAYNACKPYFPELTR